MPYGDKIDRIHSFSLGDFHDFDSCVFRFFVQHHLQKKYELAEGNANQAIGSLLDLALKKLHLAKAYNQPPDDLLNLIKAAEVDIKNEVEMRGKNSFFGTIPPFLTPEVIVRAQDVFKNYLVSMKGKIKPVAPTNQMKKIKPFWERIIKADLPTGEIKIWGGPDSIEMGSDEIPEVVDYKYFEDSEKSKSYLDMDLMPKIYVLLTANDLLEASFDKARFVTRIWTEPLNNDYYEEFDLNEVCNLENFFKDKIERILRTKELNFCGKDWCKACKSKDREEWIAELKVKGWIT